MIEFESTDCPRLNYELLVKIFPDTGTLKNTIVTTIWNDDRLLRKDIKDIAIMLLDELKRG
jgi:hypothetical protein